MNILPRFFCALFLVLMFIDAPLSGPLENLLLVEKVEKASKAGNLELAERLLNKISDTAMQNILLVELGSKAIELKKCEMAGRLIEKAPTMSKLILRMEYTQRC
ncbi:MAG: hypothetical protein VYA17_05815 [Pseudomonadota bacterium]|nr:hypothetical protein [Pseudomonadota bacterium]